MPNRVRNDAVSGVAVIGTAAIAGTVDVSASALPSGAATAALQTTGNTSLASIDAKLTSPITVTGPLTDTQLRATAVPVSAASLPLPAGAATAAKQDTGNTSLASIDAGIPAALGQTTMAASMPVVVASDQSDIPVRIKDTSGASITVGQKTPSTSLPTVGAELPTFIVAALSIAIGNGKSMLSIENLTGSPVVIRVFRIWIVNVQTAVISGINAEFEALKFTTHSVGTLLTPQAMDSADSVNANVTCRTGATLVGTATTAFKRWLWRSDEWGVGGADVESSDHSQQTLTPAFESMKPGKPITIRPNEGFTINQITNSTAGTFDLFMEFTQE